MIWLNLHFRPGWQKDNGVDQAEFWRESEETNEANKCMCHGKEKGGRGEAGYLEPIM